MSAFDDGYDLFKREPELMLVEVYWHAQARGYKKSEQNDYINGYRAARAKHDDYMREQK